jgi:hypothetical protein
LHNIDDTNINPCSKIITIYMDHTDDVRFK